MADYLAWKEFTRTNATSLPLAGIENDEKDDNVSDVSHTINLSLISDFGTNQENVKVEEQPKVNPRLESEKHKASLSTLILRSLPFSEFIVF